MAERLTIYADYVCPFCYLGRRSLAEYRAEREAPLPIEWHPFDLRADRRGPDGQLEESAETALDDAYLEQVRGKVRSLQEQLGVEMARAVATDVDSRNAQLASVHVQLEHPDDWAAFDRGLYEALWQDERDVGDPAVIGEVAAGVGLDADEIRGALQDDLVERRLDDQFEAARLRGIRGVPTFVFGEASVRGAVPPAELRRLVEDG